MAISYLYDLSYQQAPGSCTGTTKFNDVGAGDSTTSEGSTGFPPHNITGLIDCGTTGPFSPVNKVKATVEGGSGAGNTWILETSNDGTTWTSQGTTTGTPNAFANIEWPLSPDLSVQYYRIGNGGNGGISFIGDLRIYDASNVEIITSAPATVRRRTGGSQVV